MNSRGSSGKHHNGRPFNAATRREVARPVAAASPTVFRASASLTPISYRLALRVFEVEAVGIVGIIPIFRVIRPLGRRAFKERVLIVLRRRYGLCREVAWSCSLRLRLSGFLSSRVEIDALSAK